MLLLTWHGTVICLAGEGGGLLHLSLPLAAGGASPLDFGPLEFIPVGAGGLEVGPRAAAIAAEGVRLTHPDLGPITIAPGLQGRHLSVARFGRFLCAEGHTAVMAFDRDRAAEWESFRAIAAADLALLRHIVGHRWIVRDTRRVIARRAIRLLEGFRLRIGPMVIDLARLMPRAAADEVGERPDRVLVPHDGAETEIVLAHPRHSLLLPTKEWPVRSRRTAELLAIAAHRHVGGGEPEPAVFEADAAMLEVLGGAAGMEDLLERMAEEQAGIVADDASEGALADRVPAASYLAPRDLQVTPSPPARIWAIGSCFLNDALGDAAATPEGMHIDFGLVSHIHEVPEPPDEIGSYDCVLIQIPMRPIVHDAAFADLGHADIAGYQAAFKESCRALGHHLKRRLKWNIEHGTRTFVMNFMQPQFSTVGRFGRRFDLRNPEFFVLKLNQELERLVAGHRYAHVLDVDRISASLGRRHVQDDLFTAFNHNARAAPGLRLENRMEMCGPLSDYYDFSPGHALRGVLFAELDAMLRTVRQIDSVKMVVVDLDDTLWRGVSGDTADIGPMMIEGWPLGLIEALQALRRRGILLAIASKNDEARVRAIWPAIFGTRLKLEDFAMLRIDWRPKHENMAEMLKTIGLLSRNVVFIDDNPVERAQMQAAFPEMRMLGANPFHLRRALLLAPETQTVLVSAESSARTAMVRGQVQREQERDQFTPDEFARQQDVRVSLSLVTAEDDRVFARALELINKTNQFNTTGKRWREEDCRVFFAEGGTFVTYQVRDRYTEYGLVGVVMLRGHEIVQWVMSCRVLGMGAERAVMNEIVTSLRAAGAGVIGAVLVKTAVNQPAQRLYADAAFQEDGGKWVLPAGHVPPAPPFVTVQEEQMAS